jgi:Protein of unknown function (DUF1573)
MKKFLSLFMAFALFAGTIAAQTSTPNTDGPVMEFETTEVDYGVVAYDSDPYRSFKFKNTGNEPLQITHAKGSCGCTIPEYPKEPIFPGESAEIKVRYDTKRDTGQPFIKKITVSTNEKSGQDRTLTIKGTVLKRTEEPAAIPNSEPSILSPQG